MSETVLALLRILLLVALVAVILAVTGWLIDQEFIKPAEREREDRIKREEAMSQVWADIRRSERALESRGDENL